MQKQQWIRNGRSSKQSQHGESQEQEGGYFGSTKRHKERPLCYVGGHVSPQKRGVGTPNYRTFKSEFLRGDIVKDDSGAFAVFTEQGSSASQMTAAEVMDVIARLPDCDGQELLHSVSPHPSKIGGRSQTAQNSWVWMSRHMDTSSTTQMAEILGKHWTSSGASNAICVDTHLQDCCCRDSWRKFCWNLDGKKYLTGNVYLIIKNKDYSCPCTWMTSKCWKEPEYWSHVEEVDDKTLILVNPQHFLIMYSWDVLNVNVNRMKLLLRNIQRCLNHVSVPGQLKNLPVWEKPRVWKSLTQKQSRGPTTWKDMNSSSTS